MRAPVDARLVRLAVPAAASFAITAMLGSLYYSEVAGYVPCQLCWYQRIAMYSLAIILFIAAVRRDEGIAIYGLSLSVLGFGISMYHYYAQLFPRSDTCGPDASCSVRWVDVFGFVSIPLMAGAGFFGIAASMLYLLKARST
ncbi:MAG: disulfide bond formation protein B [Acidimicrobiia bacterium]|nr:disulfide bond formation protein B [Acidimicrobiia bacterium]